VKSINSLLITFVIATVLFAESNAFSHIFVSVTPNLKQSLLNKLPLVKQAIAEDEMMAKDLGVLQKSDIKNLSFNFSQMITLNDFEYSKLYEVSTLAELILKKSKHFSIPICIDDSCKGITIFTWDNKSLELQYAGRPFQAAEFQSASEKIERLGPNTEGVKIITTDVLNFVYIPQLDGRPEKIIPAGETTEGIIKSTLELDYEGASFELSLEQFKELVQKREAEWQSANDDEKNAGFPVEDNKLEPEDFLESDSSPIIVTTASKRVDLNGNASKNNLTETNQNEKISSSDRASTLVLAPESRTWLYSLLFFTALGIGIFWLKNRTKNLTSQESKLERSE